MNRRISVLIIASFSLGCGGNDQKICPDADCANYAYKEDAQKAFDADPDCMKALDSDNDYVACENLPSSGGTTGGGGSGGGGAGGCNTSSNCGCSGKRKAECESACCKWIVGTGCKCK